MTNNIPTSLFIFFALIDFVSIAIAYQNLEKPKPVNIIASVFSAFLSFILANMIINGTVYELAEQSTTYVRVAVQSQPVNYIFLGAGVIMSVTSAVFVFTYISNYLDKEKSFSALGDWK